MTNQITTVNFHGQSLPVIPQDDQLLVSIKPICENMGITWGSQYNRIKRNPILSEGIFIMKTPSNGGDQETICLPLGLLNGWLFGIDTKRIKDEAVRQRVLEYQRECYQVLFNYWHHGIAQKEPHPTKHPQFKQNAESILMFNRVACHRWRELDQLTAQHDQLLRRQRQLVAEQQELLCAQEEMQQRISKLRTDLYDPIHEPGHRMHMLTCGVKLDHGKVKQFITMQNSARSY